MHGLLDSEATNLDPHRDFAWFEKHLPTRIKNARAYIFKYHWQASRIALPCAIDDAAKNLLSVCGLNETQSAENSVANWPVVLVCYGFGGIVVKKALLLADTRSDQPSLARRTLGIVFLETPHASTTQDWAGSLKDVSIAEDANDCLCKSAHSNEGLEWRGKKTNSLNGIDNKSRILKRTRFQTSPEFCSSVCKSFSSVARLYTSIAFDYDGGSPCHLVDVLHQDCLWSLSSPSRILRYENSRYTIPPDLPLKYAKNSVELAITSLTEEVAKEFKEHRMGVYNQQVIREMHSKQRLQNTGRWILETHDFRAWLNAERSSILWLRGRPGAGKSVLCSFLIDSLQNREKQSSSMVYFFFDHALAGSDPAQFFLRTLLYQFTELRISVLPYSVLRSTLRFLSTLATPMTEAMLKERLKIVLTNINERAWVTLVVDGMHNYPWLENVIVDEIAYINSCSRRPRPLRCILSTRNPCCTLSHVNQIARISLDDELGLQQDILKFALSRLAEFQYRLTRKAPSIDWPMEQLCTRANGNFLWAALAIEDILYMNCPTDLEEEIGSMPSCIDGLYQRRLEGIPSSRQEAARILFLWLIGARQLLRFPELQGALNMQNMTSSNSRKPHGITSVPFNSKRELFEAEIYNLCRGLIVFSENGFARFRHSSLRDYLVAPGRRVSSRDCLLESHELIAKTCLQDLWISKESQKTALFDVTNFLFQNNHEEPASALTAYAIDHLCSHYRLVESNSRFLVGTLQRHLSAAMDKACKSLLIRPSQRSIQIASTMLRISAYHGFAGLAKLVLETGSHPDGNACDRCETPLTIAAARCQSDTKISSLFLQKGATITHNTEPKYNAALLAATARGLLDAVKFNLARGADPHSSHSSGETPLHIAASLGNVEMVELLMKNGADVNAMIKQTFESPLHLAAANGHLAVIECLVDKRDASRKEVDLYQSIVHDPSYERWSDSLLSAEDHNQILVWEIDAKDLVERKMQELFSCSDRSVEINKQTREGLTALHLAASNGNEEIIMFLLARGAIVHLADCTGRTALQNAAENGYLDAVKLLIQAGANKRLEADSLRLIIKSAHEKGHQDVAKLLSIGVQLTGKTAQWPTIAAIAKKHQDELRYQSIKRQIQRRISSWKPHRNLSGLAK